MILGLHFALIMIALLFAVLEAAEVQGKLRWLGVSFAFYLLSLLLGLVVK